ncbi:MAG: MerR family transcriptional regulator [Candidatus Eisenbacteria bacterium]|nr:MerR family transcriptional regulator [Candidatus Eisenbacteria bacterium]
MIRWNRRTWSSSPSERRRESMRWSDVEQTLTIGEVARMAGVNVQTVRYYERRHLVPHPPRRSSGYRAYPLDTVLRIRAIKRAQDLGFSLEEVRSLLSLDQPSACADRESKILAGEAIRVIEGKMARLGAMKARLQIFVREHGAESAEPCAIVDVLNEGVRAGEASAVRTARHRRRGV